LAEALRNGGAPPIPFEEIVTTMRLAFAARRRLAE
jgi:hypothetical protein